MNCSGFPMSTTCRFTPQQIAVSATAQATGTLTIQKSTGYNRSYTGEYRRRRYRCVLLQLLPPLTGDHCDNTTETLVAVGGCHLGVLLLTIGLAIRVFVWDDPGCASTPAGTSNVTVTANFRQRDTQTMCHVIALTVN